MKPISIDDFEPDRSISEDTLWLYECIPISVSDEEVVLAAAESPEGIVEDFQKWLGKRVTVVEGERELIMNILHRYYDNGPIIGGAELS